MRHGGRKSAFGQNSAIVIQAKRRIVPTLLGSITSLSEADAGALPAGETG